jgi:pSer/pThr/pTyr-binding forkhead associated (FHA) protein
MGETPAVELMIMSGPEDGTVLRLDQPKQGDAYILGRREDCDVVLMYDNQVSRQHTRLFMADGQWRLQDLGSRNGTYIGKQKIDGIAPLEWGQMFRMGRTWIRLQANSADSSQGIHEED